VLQCVSQHLMFLTSLCSFKSLKSLKSLKSFSDEPYVSKFCVCKHLAHSCRPSLLAMMAFNKAGFKNKLKDKDDKNDEEKGEDLVSLIQHHGCLYSVYVSLMFSESYDLNYSCESYDL